MARKNGNGRKRINKRAGNFFSFSSKTDRIQDLLDHIKYTEESKRASTSLSEEKEILDVNDDDTLALTEEEKLNDPKENAKIDIDKSIEEEIKPVPKKRHLKKIKLTTTIPNAGKRVFNVIHIANNNDIDDIDNMDDIDDNNTDNIDNENDNMDDISINNNKKEKKNKKVRLKTIKMQKGDYIQQDDKLKALTNCKTIIEDFYNLIKNVNENLQYINSKFTEADHQKIDLEHNIELEWENCYQTFMTARQMKYALMKRRDYKDLYNVLYHIQQFVNCHPLIIEETSHLLDKIQKTYDLQTNRVYYPRSDLDLAVSKPFRSLPEEQQKEIENIYLISRKKNKD